MSFIVCVKLALAFTLMLLLLVDIIITLMKYQRMGELIRRYTESETVDVFK